MYSMFFILITARSVAVVLYVRMFPLPLKVIVNVEEAFGMNPSMISCSLYGPEPGNTSNLTAELTPQLNASYRSEEHTSELQSRENLVCRLLLEKKKLKFANHN